MTQRRSSDLGEKKVHQLHHLLSNGKNCCGTKRTIPSGAARKSVGTQRTQTSPRFQPWFQQYFDVPAPNVPKDLVTTKRNAFKAIVLVNPPVNLRFTSNAQPDSGGNGEFLLLWSCAVWSIWSIIIVICCTVIWSYWYWLISWYCYWSIWHLPCFTMFYTQPRRRDIIWCSVWETACFKRTCRWRTQGVSGWCHPLPGAG